VTISEGLRRCLLADPAIAALVGTRVFPLRLPQNPVLPGIVIHRMTGVRYPHLRGGAAIARPLFQIDCWDRTYDASSHLGALVRQRLEGFAGYFIIDAVTSPETTTYAKVKFLDERDDFQTDILGGICRHSSDYHIWHSTAGGLI
jgi:Protein of unknown function (DUF3168)